MLRKTIKYEDYNGVNQEEIFLFNLNKAELLRFDQSFEGGLETYTKRIANERDNALLSKLFEDLILISYGKKSDDGKVFLKNDTIRENFKCSAAYDALYWELMTDADAAGDFFTALIPSIPQDQREQLKAQFKDAVENSK